MNETRATRYQRLRRRARGAAMAGGAVMLAIVALTPAGRWLADAVQSYGDGLPGALRALVATTLFVVCLVALWEMASLPAIVYLARRVDARYGTPVPPLADVMGAQLSAALVVLPVAWSAALVVQIAARVTGPFWWLAAGVLIATGLVVLMHGGPALLARVSGARPVTRDALLERLASLARRANVSIHSIDVVPDERGATALVAGVGHSCRVFISSEMALHWSDEEIEVVVAHELAHHAHRDLWRTLVLDAALAVTALGGAQAVIGAWGPALGWPAIGELAALPIVALVAGAGWLAVTPVRHALSRMQERRADEFALALTGGVAAFASALRRLGARHLVEERPSRVTRWLHHRHPSVAERLALAEQKARQAPARPQPPVQSER